ncbi:MAG: hypothetical protein WBC97_11215 [Gemmatimonadales bacterium]
MKDQYFGDVNDYRKYGLLRALESVTGLSLGVCWLLTSDDGGTDGGFTDFLLQPGQWRRYDPPLYDELRRLLDPGTRRSVQHVRTWSLIPGARYYEAGLADGSGRERYIDGALDALQECPVVFFDPDNGVEVPSIRFGGRGSSKYIYWQEMEQAYRRGHTLVVYQHFAREKREQHIARLAEQFRQRLQAPMIASFRTPRVVFFLAVQSDHIDKFAGLHERVRETWGDQIRPCQHTCD